MGYPKEVYDRAWEALSRRRREAEEQRDSRREEIHARIPEVARIERGLAATAAGVAKSIVANPGDAARQIDRLRAENLELQQHRAALLAEHGYPPDYLDERHGCDLCHDSGYVGERMCTCLRELLKQAACERLGAAARTDASTFDAFSLDLYPETPVDSSGVVPRQRMGQVLSYCRTYAHSFARDSESLLLIGRTGLGKTHLSLAIASTATEAGFGVLYSPVQRLMDRLEAERFSRGGQEQYNETLEQVLACDLLVLDDLGTEFHTQFTTSVLYNLINSRLVENRPTIISTNLELAQIEELYTQRMVSRLVCSYKVLKFYGKDIRFIKKQSV